MAIYVFLVPFMYFSATMPLFLMRLLSLLGSAFGVFIANAFGRSEGTAIHITGIFFITFGIILLGFIFLFRFYSCRLKDKYGFPLVLVLYLSLLVFIYFWCFLIRLDLSAFFPLVSTVVGGQQALPLPGPAGPSSSSSWTSFDEGVLLEPFSPGEAIPSILPCQGRPAMRRDPPSQHPPTPLSGCLLTSAFALCWNVTCRNTVHSRLSILSSGRPIFMIWPAGRRFQICLRD